MGLNATFYLRKGFFAFSNVKSLNQKLVSTPNRLLCGSTHWQ